jgi:hypothetical protein
MRFACVRTRTNSLCISTCNHSELNRSVEKRPDLRALFFISRSPRFTQGPKDEGKMSPQDRKGRKDKRKNRKSVFVAFAALL